MRFLPSCLDAGRGLHVGGASLPLGRLTCACEELGHAWPFVFAWVLTRRRISLYLTFFVFTFSATSRATSLLCGANPVNCLKISRNNVFGTIQPSLGFVVYKHNERHNHGSDTPQHQATRAGDEQVPNLSHSSVWSSLYLPPRFM